MKASGLKRSLLLMLTITTCTCVSATKVEQTRHILYVAMSLYSIIIVSSLITSVMYNNYVVIEGQGNGPSLASMGLTSSFLHYIYT